MMDVLYCAACGAPNDVDAVYCTQCGEKLRHPEQFTNNGGSLNQNPRNADTYADTCADTREEHQNNAVDDQFIPASVHQPPTMADVSGGSADSTTPVYQDPAPVYRSPEPDSGSDSASTEPTENPPTPQPQARKRKWWRVVLAVIAVVAVVVIVWYFVLVPRGILTFGLGSDTSVEADASAGADDSTDSDGSDDESDADNSGDSDDAEESDGGSEDSEDSQDSDDSDDSGTATTSRYPTAQEVIASVDEGNYVPIVGRYCRSNGACITISKSSAVGLTDVNGESINPSEWSGMYPFSSYSQGIVVSAGWDDSEGVPSTTASVHLKLAIDASSCAAGTLDDPICNAPDGGWMYLDVDMYYIPAGTSVDAMKAEVGAQTDGDDPDESRPYLVFQIEAGTNAPFDASDDAVFYLEEQ